MPRAGENTYILLRLLTKHLYCFSKLRDYRLQIGIIESNNNRRIILYPIRISDVRRHESEIRFTRRGMKPKLKKAIAHTLLAISCLTKGLTKKSPPKKKFSLSADMRELLCIFRLPNQCKYT